MPTTDFPPGPGPKPEPTPAQEVLPPKFHWARSPPATVSCEDSRLSQLGGELGPMSYQCSGRRRGRRRSALALAPVSDSALAETVLSMGVAVSAALPASVGPHRSEVAYDWGS